MFVNDIFKNKLNEGTATKPAMPSAPPKATASTAGPMNRNPDDDIYEHGIEEAGPFSYGAKKPRKGSVADLAAKKRQEQERGKQPVEPRDQMVGVAKVVKEYGDTPKGQKQLTRVHKRAVDRLIKADDKNMLEPDYTKRDLKTVRKNQATADRAWDRMTDLEEQGVAEAHGPYGQIKAKDLERIKKAKEREKKNVPGQLTRPPTSKQRYPNSSLQYFSKFDEGSAQDKLYKRHQELRKKSGLPDPEYYKELKASYDLPDEERYAKQKEIKQKYKVTNEDRERYIEELGRAGYEIVNERRMTCPECGGLAYEDRMLAEKQDACYHKVKSRYKVWPSAYASGALVRCRKKGAKNWGNKSK